MKIEIIDSKLFINSVDEIIQRENSFIIVLNNGDTIVYRRPFKKNYGNQFGFRIIDLNLIQDVKTEKTMKKSVQPKSKSIEKKKRNFSEKQIEHQQRFSRKMKDFWNKERTDSE